MVLEELGVKTQVIVQSRTKIDTIEFNAVITDIDKVGVWLDIDKADDKIINFTSDDVKSDIIAYVGEKMFVFKNVKILIEGHDGKKSHYCWKGTVGELVNRRSTPRYIVNRTCSMRRNRHSGVTRAHLKDVSQEGFAVICTGEPKLGDLINISLTLDGTLLFFEGEAVRIIEDNSHLFGERKLVGCKLLNDNKNLNQWIMRIQRERLRIQRGG